MILFRRRSAQGERGLKLDGRDETANRASRSPHGERGLKLREESAYQYLVRVAPRKGSVG